uniref:Uncharacterized protein n=1 Tax=Helianthus annuus TaxID=4232 RepID=A0A251V8B8_HELAN
MFSSLNHRSRSSAAKFVPLSVIIRSGRPKRHMICSQINRLTTADVVDASAFASTHLVK